MDKNNYNMKSTLLLFILLPLSIFSQTNRSSWLNYKYSDNGCLFKNGRQFGNLLHLTELPIGYKLINTIDKKEINDNRIVLSDWVGQNNRIINEGIKCPILNTRETEIYYKPQGKMLLWDDSKEPISEDIYDDIEKLGINDYLVKKNHKKGVIDTSGRIILPIEYDDIQSVDPDILLDSTNCVLESSIEFYSVKKGKEWAILNKDRKVIFPFKKIDQPSVSYFILNNDIYIVICYGYFVNNKFKTSTTITKLLDLTSSVHDGIRLEDNSVINWRNPYLTIVAESFSADPISLKLNHIFFNFKTRSFENKIGEFWLLKRINKNHVLYSNNKTKLINDNLDVLIPEKYSEIEPLINLFGYDHVIYPDSSFVVSLDNKCGLYILNKGEIIRPDKMSIYRIKGDKLLVQNEDKTYSIFKTTGEVFTTKKYDKIDLESKENSEEIKVTCILNGKIDEFFF
jgi:hypothetical protein